MPRRRLTDLQREYRRAVHRARLLFGDDAAEEVASDFACDPPQLELDDGDFVQPPRERP